MKKAILLLTMSGLVLGVAVLKMTECSPGEDALIVAVLDLSKRNVSSEAKNLEVTETVAVAPAPIEVAAAEPVKMAPQVATGEAPAIKAGPVNEDEAVMIALMSIPGDAGKVDYEGGHYKVSIRSTEGRRAKVYVDAASGEVYRIKMKS